MAERLYTGLVNKQLRGNREDALTLEREARTKVGYLFDSMMPGQTFKTGSWSLGNGRRIMAFVWNDVLGKRATVRLTGVGGRKPAYLLFFLELGWLTWDLTSTVWPLRIYTTQKERNYFNTGQLFQAGAYDTFEETLWLPTAPRLQPPGDWYESLNWTGAGGQGIPSIGNDQPALFTGLARLWAQGCLAAGSTPTLRLASKYPFNVVNGLPKRLGVLRFPHDELGYIWWMVVITAVGTWVMRMQIPEAFQAAITHLKQGFFIDSLDASQTEAYILGNAEFPDDPIQVKTEEEMDAVYQGRTHDRWDFCDQRLGTLGENQQKAITVINGGMYGTVPNKYYTSHIARMTAGVDQDGYPLVSFAMTDPENWALGTASGARWYIPFGEGSWYSYDESDSGIYENYATGQGAVIVAFHNPNGTEHIITNETGVASVLIDTGAIDWIDYSKHCGPGTKTGLEHYLAKTPIGFGIDGIAWAQDEITAQTYEMNTYTLVLGTTTTFDVTFYQSPPASGNYYYTFYANDCAAEFTIGPYTVDEANALNPATSQPPGAGMQIVTDHNSYSEQVACKLLVGYYPRTYGFVFSKQTIAVSAFDQTQTRLDDTTGDSVYLTIGGHTQTYEKDVSNEMGIGTVETTLTYKEFPDPVFRAIWRTEQGIYYEDANSGNFGWTDGDEISGNWYSFSSYTGEEIVALIGDRVLPPGMADVAVDTYDVGAFIGGA